MILALAPYERSALPGSLTLRPSGCRETQGTVPGLRSKGPSVTALSGVNRSTRLSECMTQLVA